MKTVGRRTFITAVGGAGAVAVLAAASGRGLRGSSPAARSRSLTTLPKAKRTIVVPATQPFTVEGQTPYVTPNADFYLIDTALVVPQLEAATWSMSVKGMVDNPFKITYAELLDMDMVEEPVTISCVSNEVGGDLIGTAMWLGVPLKTLLDRAKVKKGATQIVGRSVDDFTAGFPTEKALDGRTALVAVGMNGEPLPVKHGFPARLVVPGLYGYVSATKWLHAVTLTTLEETTPFWVQRGWTADGRIEAASRIDVPRDGVRVPGGRVAVGGRAWHQHTGVGSVEVKVDDGAWNEATLAEPISTDTWRLWSWTWDATPGPHTLTVRMHDTNGTPQSSDEHPVYPGASSGLHTIAIDVS